MWEPVSDTEALRVRCSKCGMASGEGCVYIWPKGVNPDSNCLSPEARLLVYRVGKPTRRPHTERRDAFRAQRERDRQRAHSASPFREVSIDARAAARAQSEFDRREYHQLRLWFARHGHLFKEWRQQR